MREIKMNSYIKKGAGVKLKDTRDRTVMFIQRITSAGLALALAIDVIYQFMHQII
jgi:hypothetical protein